MVAKISEGLTRGLLARQPEATLWGVLQAAAPLGEVSRSAGSRRGQSEWQNSRFGGDGGVGCRGLPGGVLDPIWAPKG